MSSRFFKPELAAELELDAQALLGIIQLAGPWLADREAKLQALQLLVQKKHKGEKVLVFTQFADTAGYLARELQKAGVKQLEAVTGNTDDPTAAAMRFSPESNGMRKSIPKADEIRVLIATDILSEGQNLQDAAIVVNYDLPWAIIRLIQRAGRVDRIGQKAHAIDCYTFMPAEGVERIIQLRERVRDRLKANAEVIGTDESFFEDDDDSEQLRNLYDEKAGALDDPQDDEVDLSSYAWQVWNNATKENEALRLHVENLPNVVYTSKEQAEQDGVLVYLRTAEDNDALAWLTTQGKVVTESQLDILRAAACVPDTPALPRLPNHHELVLQAVQALVELEHTSGGNLGRRSGPRARTYERLKRLAHSRKRTLFPDTELELAVDDIYRRPLKETAYDSLRRQLKSGVADDDLAELVKIFRAGGKLVQDDEETARREPQIICSLGLA